VLRRTGKDWRVGIGVRVALILLVASIGRDVEIARLARDGTQWHVD
jgi:hypothetical protein